MNKTLPTMQWSVEGLSVMLSLRGGQRPTWQSVCRQRLNGNMFDDDEHRVAQYAPVQAIDVMMILLDVGG